MCVCSNLQELAKAENRLDFGFYGRRHHQQQHLFLFLISQHDQALIDFIHTPQGAYMIDGAQQMYAEYPNLISFNMLLALHHQKHIPFNEEVFVRQMYALRYHRTQEAEATDLLLQYPYLATEVFPHTTKYIDASLSGNLEWQKVFALLCEKDYFPDRSFVASFIEVLLNPWKKNVLDMYCRWVEGLSPTPTEILTSQHTLFALLTLDKPSLINFAMKLIDKVQQDPSFDFQAFTDSFALCFTNAKVAKSQAIGLSILAQHYQREAPKSPAYREMLASLFTQPDAKVQEALADLLLTYFNTSGLAEIIAPYEAYIKESTQQKLKIITNSDNLPPTPLSEGDLGSQHSPFGGGQGEVSSNNSPILNSKEELSENLPPTPLSEGDSASQHSPFGGGQGEVQPTHSPALNSKGELSNNLPPTPLSEGEVSSNNSPFGGGEGEVQPNHSPNLNSKEELSENLPPTPLSEGDSASQHSPFGGGEGEVQPTHSPFLSSLGEVTIPTTWDALLFLIGDCLREPTAAHIDALLEGLIQQHDNLPADFVKQVAPYVKQLTKRTGNDSPADSILLALLIALSQRQPLALDPKCTYTWEEVNAKRKSLEPKAFDAYMVYYYLHNMSQALPFLFRKAQITVERILRGNPLPLLSTPTHLPFYISADTLMDKLLLYEAQGEAPDLDDLIVACNRLYIADISATAKTKAQTLQGDYAPALQYYLGVSQVVAPTEALLPLWAQVTRIKCPDKVFAEFGNTISEKMIGVVSPYRIAYGWAQDPRTDDPDKQKFVYELPPRRAVVHKKKTDTLYRYYNHNGGVVTAYPQYEYYLSLNPHYLNALLCQYAAEAWDTGNEVREVAQMTQPLEGLLRHDLPVRHSGWQYIGACLLFEKRPARDLAYEYLCRALARSEEVGELTRYLATVLASGYLPITRFIELLDRPRNPLVKTFTQEVLRQYLDLVPADKLPRNHKKLLTYIAK
ncbi:MAG: DUF6493 family protein [Capnocytophaga sp.]|nr:DUF6493 family protein [Capnocytophaga sp.]